MLSTPGAIPIMLIAHGRDRIPSEMVSASNTMLYQ